MSGSKCCSWPAYRFLRRQVWYSHLFKNFPQFVVIHTVKVFGIVNKTEVDAFLEFPCFLYDPTNVCNLISCSFAFSKSSLYIWNFSVHILLKVQHSEKMIPNSCKTHTKLICVLVSQKISFPQAVSISLWETRVIHISINNPTLSISTKEKDIFQLPVLLRCMKIGQWFS